MDRAGFLRWVAAYEQAWRTAGTAAVEHLFTPDATYSPAPFRPSFDGLDAISAMWKAERDGPDEAFGMAVEVLAVEGRVGVARVEVVYGPPKDVRYLDLWVVRFAQDGRCEAFEEWPFWPPGQHGAPAGGG